MIDGVLNYSTLNQEQQPTERLDLNNILEHIETDLELAIQQKNATIRRGPLPQIEGASVLIYQLFYNLINNSLKFSRQEAAPVISLLASSPDSKGIVRISIEDNGIGFEQMYADRIFDTFTRLNSKDQFEGTGLGLALCKKIVERHHGTISATGKPGEGAVFTIEIPTIQSTKQV